MSLRLTLLLIGLAIVALVYVVTAAKRRRDQRASVERRFTRFNIPDVIFEEEASGQKRELPTLKDTQTHERKLSTPEISRLEEPGAGAPALPRKRARAPLPKEFVLPPEDQALEDLPKVRNDAFANDEPGNARLNSDQMDLFGAAGEPTTSTVDVQPREPGADTPDNGLITLFVRSVEGQQFRGPELVRCLNAVGMKHGEMSIFHHFGAGELRSRTTLFSAANMFEPGTFDLTRIEAFRTSGIVFFLQLPTSFEGAVAFELLLNTAQRLSELLGGELFVTPKSPLTSREIARLRSRAAQFAADGSDI